MANLYEELAETSDPSKSSADMLAKRFSDVVADASDALNKSFLRPVEIAAVLKLYDSTLRLSASISEIRATLQKHREALEKDPDREIKLTKKEGEAFSKFFDGVEDFDEALDSIDLSILDVFYPGLSEALHRSTRFDVYFHTYFNEYIVPEFNLTRKDIRPSLKRLVNRFDARFVYRCSMTRGLAESLAMEPYGSADRVTPETINAISNFCETIQQCKNQIGELVRQTWTFRELTDTGTFKKINVEVTMGDKFENIKSSTILSRSNVERSFNEASGVDKDDIAKALNRIANIIAESNNPQAVEDFQAFKDETEKDQPRKSVLRALWSSITAQLPSIVQMTDVVGKIVKLFTN